MGLFDLFKKKPTEEKQGYSYAPTMSGGAPFYAPFGDSLYASDIVIQSIRCKANEFKKLKPRHIKTTNGTQTVVTDSSVARMLRRPNEYMTTADFLEKCAIMLELNRNVFIYPQYYRNQAGEKVYERIYPLKPATVEYLVDKAGKYFIRFGFANGYKATIPADDVIHWRKDFYDDYFGGNSGFDDTVGQLKAVREYDKLCQSISKAVACSCQINGVMKYNSYMSDDKQEAERAAFEAKLAKNESGILFTDMKTEYTHLERDVKLVDAETLKFFYDTILRANGTSLAILNGDYTKAQKEAYYEHALEADIISLGQAMSKCIFSDRQESFGNEIVLYPNNIVFMSMENKIGALQTGLPAGIFMKDEARELLGYPPLPNGSGQVIAQGYNNLLDENNNNKLSDDQSDE